MPSRRLEEIANAAKHDPNKVAHNELGRLPPFARLFWFESSSCCEYDDTELAALLGVNGNVVVGEGGMSCTDPSPCKPVVSEEDPAIVVVIVGTTMGFCLCICCLLMRSLCSVSRSFNARLCFSSGYRGTLTTPLVLGVDTANSVRLNGW